MLSSSIVFAGAKIGGVWFFAGFFWGGGVSRCLLRYYRHDKGNITTTIQSRTNEKKNDMIVLPFSRVGKTKSCCFICKRKNSYGASETTRDTFICSMVFLY